MTRTLKVDELTYRRLNRIAGSIRTSTGRPVSLAQAIRRLLDVHERASPSDFAGSWKMSDEEVQEMEATLRRMWSTWRIE